MAETDSTGAQERPNASAPAATAPLPRSTVAYYGLSELPISLSLFPVLVFIPKFYTSDLGVNLAFAANVILAVRILDVLTDPLAGILCDRTQTRWGRRKPWLVAATPLMMLSIYMLFLPPEGAGAAHLFGWMVTLSIATTMMLIPYYAWAAELSPDYNERSRITGFRSMMGAIGSLIAQLVPAIALVAFGLGGSEAVLTIVGVTMLILMPICVFLTVWKVPETGEVSEQQTPFWRGLKLMGENRPFLQLILAFGVASTALSMTTPLYLFFITFVLGAEEKAIFMLTFFYLTNVSAVPFWVWLSRKIGKHRAYVGSFGLIAIAHPFYLLLGPGDFWWMLPITITTGFAAGGFAALPNSMKADVIDLDTLKSGENRAGLFFSTWSFTAKLAASLGAWLALMGLSWFGFDSSPTGSNDADQLFGLRFLFALAPSVFYLGACALIWSYPITAERHAAMRAELAAAREAA
ncbi:MAG: MFS transporter [Pseudomonadota bacterium]